MKLRELDEKELERLYQSDQDPEVHQERDVQEQKEPGQGIPRRRFNMGSVILMLLGVITLILLAVYLVMLFRSNDSKNAEEASGIVQNTFTQQQVDALLADAVAEAKSDEAARILSGIKQNLSQGMAVARALRPFYEDEVVVATGGKIRFFPIQDGIRKNNYSVDNLMVSDNGQLQYKEKDQVITQKGIDVSHHQGEIDWKLVAEDGVEFAFIRVGLRGYGTGKVVVDEQFENNIKGALSNGIKVGVYFYSQSINEAEVLEEAQLVLEQIAPYKVTGPVVYDAEKVEDSRTSSLSMEERTAMAVTFCEKVKEAGYRPMVYLNLDTAFSMLDLTKLEDYDKWLAHYGTDMYYPYAYNIWQYTEKGTVNGISTAVDLNISFETWE